METKDFQDTINYLQECNNDAIISWQAFLADVMSVVLNARLSFKS